jgi:RNA polymerase sigma factor (sigma-70 family)
MENRKEQDDFVRLISANKGIIIKICNCYCVNQTDREDLAQEIIFFLWKGSKKYNPVYKFSTWMYTVALNVAISFYRSSKRTKNVITFIDGHSEMAEEQAESSNPDANSNLLQKHISALKELDKALIILHFEEKSYKEIAEIVGISETNAATKVSRIKARLKDNILNDKK